MVQHQAVRVARPREPRENALDIPQEPCPVVVVEEDRLATVSSSCDVVEEHSAATLRHQQSQPGCDVVATRLQLLDVN
jgi:hypothetical protein